MVSAHWSTRNKNKAKLLNYNAVLKQKEKKIKREFGIPQLELADFEEDDCPSS